MLEQQKNIDNNFFKNTNVKENKLSEFKTKFTTIGISCGIGLMLFLGMNSVVKSYNNVQAEIKKDEVRLMESNNTKADINKNTYLEDLTSINEKVVVNEIDRIKTLSGKKLNVDPKLFKIEDMSFSNNEIKMTLSLTDNEKMVKLFYNKSSLGEENLVLIEGSNRLIPSKKLIIENQR